jgi:hypothetical protein
MSGSREATGLDHDGGRAPSGGAWQALPSAPHERANPVGRESDAIADMLAQMRQLAEEHPEAAERLAADLTAALGRAGMHFDGEKITERAPAGLDGAREGSAASDVVGNQRR